MQGPYLNNRDSVARRGQSQVYAGRVDNSSLLATAQAREQSCIRMANTRKELLIGGKWLATRATTGTNTYLVRQFNRNLQMPSSLRGYQPKGEDKTLRTPTSRRLTRFATTYWPTACSSLHSIAPFELRSLRGQLYETKFLVLRPVPLERLTVEGTPTLISREAGLSIRETEHEPFSEEHIHFLFVHRVPLEQQPGALGPARYVSRTSDAQKRDTHSNEGAAPHVRHLNAAEPNL